LEEPIESIFSNKYTLIDSSKISQKSPIKAYGATLYIVKPHPVNLKIRVVNGVIC
jgi:hypothetical protein